MSKAKVTDTLTMVRGPGDDQATLTISVEGYSPEWVDRIKEVYLNQGWAITSHKQKVTVLNWWTTPFVTPAAALGFLVGFFFLGPVVSRWLTGG